MTRFLRDRYLWYLVALAVVLGVLAYGHDTIFHDQWELTYVASMHVLFLAGVSIAAWRFGVKGGLVASLVVGLILLPHAYSVVVGHWQVDMLLELGVLVSIGIVFSWLVGSRKRMTETLRQSGGKYRSLVNNVKLGIFRSTTGATGRFLEVNPAIEEITGYSREELLQMNVSDLYVHPEERELVLEKIASTEGKTTSELCFKKKDGTEITVSDTKVVVRDNAGRILFFDGILEDITERKQTEESLKKAHDSLLKAQEIAKFGNWSWERDKDIGFWSEEIYHMLGYTTGEIQPTFEWLLGITHPDDREQVVKDIEESMRTGKSYGGVYRLTIKDGKEIIVDSRAEVVLNQAGEATGMAGVIQDITEHKQTEEALRHAAEEWRTTFDSITDLISIYDKDYKIIRVNKAFANAFKMKPKELMGKICYEIFEGTKESPPNCTHMKTLKTKKPAVAELFVPRLGIHFEVTTSPIFNEKGEVIASIHIAKDITERKLAEAEKGELEQKAQLSSRLASVGEMASGIAHEINNPLTSVIGFTQLLMQKDIPRDIKQDVEIINDGVQRVSGIVKRLLTFARRHKLEREYIDINEVIETTLDLRAYELETGNIKVTTQLAPDLPRTMADGGQLQQVFLNIIINAEVEMQSAHGEGSLLVRTETIGNTIRISFKDDGPGIAEENLEKIFDPFFTTRDAGQGTGLGLSVCHGIISEHNGRIYGESELGKGATFVVELPLVVESPLVSAPEQPEAPEVAKPATDEVKRLTRARILVVDDEPAIRQFLSRVLADEGHKVETVDNASDALDRIKRKRYNLILLDIKMPGMSGIELYKRVREIAQPLVGRMVFITGDIMGADTRNFFSKTKAPYITKPFDAEKLKKHIHRILAESVKS